MKKFDNETLLGVDQYGKAYWIHSKYPRKDLTAQLGIKKAEKMYITDKKGNTLHIGYIIGDRWITIYKLAAWK